MADPAGDRRLRMQERTCICIDLKSFYALQIWLT